MIKKPILVVVVFSVVLAATAFFLSEQRKLERGKSLAALYCATCHLEPDPNILPKLSWEAALAYMGYWLGIEDISYLSSHPEFARTNVTNRKEVLVRENLFPAEPLLDESDWEALRYYYTQTAPRTSLPQQNKPALTRELPQFQIQPPVQHIPASVITMVHVRESTNEIYIGDSAFNTLAVLDGHGERKVGPYRFNPEISPVDIQFVDDTAYLASIGDLLGTAVSAVKPAHISAFTLVDQSIENVIPSTVLDQIYRMADMEVVDLNGDGRNDFIVCGFGVLAGSLSWFESQPDGGYVEHVLLDLPGTVRVETHDFNNDGLLDILALVADAREGVRLLVNQGDNDFEIINVFETHSAYGHTFFDLKDFNNDGRLDLLVVNGDNVDSDPYNTLKNYHGLRIYLNRGGYQFEEAYFYPMYGAFIAKSADFDEDGDPDIAAISFYPDFASEQPETFTYLENQGGLKFTAFSTHETMTGRWMTMDIGDIDGDGDVDIVLGGAYLPLGMASHPEQLDELLENGPPLLILENTLR
ncbi:MAG: VCBS repeat-containing protein [Gammaproteobacteria bacterium]